NSGSARATPGSSVPALSPTREHAWTKATPPGAYSGWSWKTQPGHVFMGDECFPRDRPVHAQQSATWRRLDSRFPRRTGPNHSGQEASFRGSDVLGEGDSVPSAGAAN